MAATLEQELSELIMHAGYEVRIWNFVYTHASVLYDGKVIAEKDWPAALPIPFFSVRRRAVRWAKKQIADHEQMLESLGPLVRPR